MMTFVPIVGKSVNSNKRHTMKIFVYLKNKFHSYSMALTRKDIESFLSNHSETVVFHTIKVLKWKDDENVHKHISDVDSVLLRFQDKKYKIRLKAADVYDWLFETSCSSERVLNTAINRILHTYHGLPVLRTNEEVYTELKKIFRSISKDLAIGNFDSLYDYLDAYEKPTFHNV